MRLSEVIERYPATVRLYAVPVNQHGFNLFLIRTASNVHGQGRAGVSVGKGSGARMDWTPEHVAAAAVRLLLLDAFGSRQAGIKTTFEALRRAVWDADARTVRLLLPRATVVLAVPRDVLAEHIGVSNFITGLTTGLVAQ